MKKIISLLLLTAIMQLVIGQTETFDIVTYTPPKNWKKDVKQGVVNYTNVNTAKGTFCVIAIYASTTSSFPPASFTPPLPLMYSHPLNDFLAAFLLYSPSD